MTPRATYTDLTALEEAAEALRTRAAHLQDIAREVEAIADAEVEDDQVVEATRRLVELDRLLTGETALDDAAAGIPGLDQVLEHHEQLVEDAE